ncbi:hypothetical protein H2200_008823 [Cladophialophora chaetospira]|uniref:Galactose oxidase n=1 Tax=Cladophialophora chaetospira TaxID=386627 RepID=A0AA38X4T8_9EURO|nr:hypothetical protein H2200_008823 [Cladophialophora chaetospira]
MAAVGTAAATTTKPDDDAKKFGKWEAPFSIENVAVHATLLHTGEILCWSRRSNPMSTIDSMDEQKTNAFLIDLSKNPKCRYTGNQPQDLQTPKEVKESNVSIFCSGHCLQPDGSLFVVGGHIKDAQGARLTNVYKPGKDGGIWTAKELPSIGRWYPSAVTLPDSSVLAISGSSIADDYGSIDLNPQIWRNGQWEKKFVKQPPLQGHQSVLPLYPRLHLDPFGRVFIAGPKAQSAILDLNAPNNEGRIGDWLPLNEDLKRKATEREYGSSVTYDVGKIIWTGGGNDAPDEAGKKRPTNLTEIIDLNVDNPKWQPSAPMLNRRRHHNATVLPDGTVLVTGGTSGGTVPMEFNDLSPNEPVHKAELWTPDGGVGKWTEMAAESSDRCYHCVALLLPDGSVFSAGSGEGGAPNPANPAKDNLTNAQIFKPPYFFQGNPPTIDGVPDETKYGKPFTVTVRGSDSIKIISWIRLGSVTHSMNSSQSVVIQKLDPPKTSAIEVKTPANRNAAVPGYYMLFFVNTQGRPSVAKIIRISPEQTKEELTLQKPAPIPSTNAMKPAARMAQVVSSIPELDEKIIAEQDRPHVTVGLTPVCPYGLGPCWAGAFEGLHSINDVDVVRPLPDQVNSVAFVYLKEDILPDIDVWRDEFARTANGSYDIRGIELTLSGVVTTKPVSGEDKLVMAGTAIRPDLVLAPFKATSKIEQDHKARALMPVSDHDLSAYTSLFSAIAYHPAGLIVKMIGRLHKHGANEFSLDVRSFELVDEVTAS